MISVRPMLGYFIYNSGEITRVKISMTRRAGNENGGQLLSMAPNGD